MLSAAKPVEPTPDEFCTRLNTEQKGALQQVAGPQGSRSC